MKFFSSLFLSLFFTLVATVSTGKDLLKIAVWDLSAGNINPSYAQDLTSILVSEISKLGKYEVYSQDNVRTLAGWTAERMQLGCIDTKCLTALGQMDIAKLISGRVGKLGDRYSVSLNLFDTQNTKSERSISEFCRSENELIELVQVAVRKLLGMEVGPSKVEEKLPEKATTELTSPDKRKDYNRGKMISPAEGLKAARERSEQEQQVKKRSFFEDPVTGMEFVFVKGGCYEMGDTFGGGFPWETAHEVCVNDFYMGKYEVTQEQWEKLMGSNPSNFKDNDKNPVECVSWNDAQHFIDRLNNQSGRKYRLPTEAEWEYAARSGGKKEKFSGTSAADELGEYAWYSYNAGGKPHPVGRGRPNGLGFYDMSGNVWEWCSDWYDEKYYKTSPRNNPKGPDDGSLRVRRGGSFSSANVTDIRAAYRGWDMETSRLIVNGFRLAAPSR
jgi:sulfatase modifying factor 1